MMKTEALWGVPIGRAGKSAAESLLSLFVLGAVVFTLIFSAPLMFRTFILDVQSVRVPDHRVGEDPMIEVTRSIRSRALLDYSVTIREAGTGRFIHSVGPPKPFRYDPAAGNENPLRRKLSWWLWSEEDLREAEQKGFGVGRYTITTCHWVAWFRLLGNCHTDGPFERLPKDGP